MSAFVLVGIVCLSGNGNGGDASPEVLHSVKENFREKTIDVKVIEGSDAPLIDRNHADSADNGSGYENGYTLYYDGKYHMLITEMFTNGGFVGYWTPARIGHWISDDGNTWNRYGTVVEGNNISGDMKMATWSPSFYWNEEEENWNVLWRGDNAAFRYKSTIAGKEGILGPYEEASIVMPRNDTADRGPRTWQSGYINSFGNVFTGADGKRYTFVSDFIRVNNQVNWPTGLVVSENGVNGPFKYDGMEEPAFNYCENPYVTQYDGMYFATYDDLSFFHSIGIGYSQDGIHWKRVIIDLETDNLVPWASQINLVGSIRTPMGSLKNADGNYTVFFTAHHKAQNYFCIGKIRLKIDIRDLTDTEKEKETYKLNLQDKDMWTSGEDADWFSEYEGMSIDDNRKAVNVRIKSDQKVDGNFDMEVFVRDVGSGWDDSIKPVVKGDARAGIVFGKQDNLTTVIEDGAYYLFVDSNKKATLYKGGADQTMELLKEVSIPKTIYMFRSLRAVVEGTTLTVYFDGSAAPLFVYEGLEYTNGYVGLAAGKEHMHFEAAYLKILR